MTTSNFQQSLFLNEEDKRQGTWMQPNMSSKPVVSPLFASFMIPAMNKGAKEGVSHIKMPMGEMATKLANGRMYAKQEAPQGEEEKRVQEHREIVRPLSPYLKDRLDQTIEQTLLPFYRQLDQARKQNLSLHEALEHVKALFAFYQKAWRIHFEVAAPYMQLYSDLEDIYKQCMGESDATVIYDLLMGVMTKFQEEDQELSKMAREVREDADLDQAFRQNSVKDLQKELSKAEKGQAFLDRLQGVMEEYGYKSANSHSFTEETWVENPAYAFSVIASYVANGYNFEDKFDRTVQERNRKYQEVINDLPEGPLKRKFLQYYEWALQQGAYIEDNHHFYIDAMLPAKSRLFLLHVGDLLVEHNVIVDREDIFYLYLDELEAALKQPESLSTLIDKRKAEYREYQQTEAPPFYGDPPEDAPADSMAQKKMGMVEQAATTEEQGLKGLAGSKGTHTGVVKVIRGQEEFDKLNDGDVLVCQNTTPPWSVLFSRAGALITDVGGILSHPAINAREYQLPAVLGTKIATEHLKDGDVVTVDGINGWVTVDEQA